MEFSGLSFRKQFEALAVQPDEWGAGRFPGDFDVVPAQLGTDPGPEGFAHGLLGGKAGCHMGGGLGMAPAIGDFGVQQDAQEETVAESLQCRSSITSSRLWWAV